MPAITHAEISAWESAPRTAQSALLPAGAPTDMYATLRANMSPLNNCWGVSKELVVRKLNSPESGAPANRFAASRSGRAVRAAEPGGLRRSRPARSATSRLGSNDLRVSRPAARSAADDEDARRARCDRRHPEAHCRHRLRRLVGRCRRFGGRLDARSGDAPGSPRPARAGLASGGDGSLSGIGVMAGATVEALAADGPAVEGRSTTTAAAARPHLDHLAVWRDEPA